MAAAVRLPSAQVPAAKTPPGVDMRALTTAPGSRSRVWSASASNAHCWPLPEYHRAARPPTVPAANRPKVLAVTWSMTEGTGAAAAEVVVVVALRPAEVGWAGVPVPVVVPGGMVEVVVDVVVVELVVVVMAEAEKPDGGPGETQAAALVVPSRVAEPTTTQRWPQATASLAWVDVPAAWGRTCFDQCWALVEVQMVAALTPPERNWVPATSQSPWEAGGNRADRVLLWPPPNPEAAPACRCQSYAVAVSPGVVVVVAATVVVVVDVEVVGTDVDVVGAGPVVVVR